MRVIGFDPDLHHAGIALIDDFGTAVPKLIAVRCPLVSSHFKGGDAVVQMAGAMDEAVAEMISEYGRPDRVVIEGQESYLGSKVRPQDLLHLALAAGAAVGLARSLCRCRIEVPRPVVWKGSIPKHVHQKRILRAVGIPYVSASNPTRILKLPEGVGFEGIKKSNFSHVIDAIGLAVWGTTT